MTKLKFELTLGDSCDLTIADTTGFVSSANPEGFVLEATSVTPYDSYKISQGYFLNVLQYNKYGVDPIVVSTKEVFENINSEDVDPDYAENFPAQTYKLVQDGVFSISRIFLISEEFYNAEKETSRFDGKTIYYTDGTKVFKINPDTEVVENSSVKDFLKDVDPSIGLISTLKIISTCLTNKCYFNIINELIASGFDVCQGTFSAELIKQRDFIFMVLEAVRYLKDQGSILEVQKILETVDTCGGICKKVSTSNDCGCG